MHRMDNDILEILSIKPKEYNLFHQRFEKIFKQMVMATPLNFLYVFLICAFLIFIILINDPRNILLIIAPLLIAFRCILSQILSQKERKILREMKKALLKSKDIENFRQSELTLHEKHISMGKWLY